MTKLPIKKVREMIAMGLWVYDTPPKSIGKIRRPEPLEHGCQLDLEDVRQLVSYDGIGYCIFEYIPASKIEDKELKKLWTAAKKSIDKVVNYLYKESQ